MLAITFKEEFWHKIPNREEVPAFVSVGRKYDLPSKEVIGFFDKNYKEIHSTNFVGGFREYFEDKNKKAKEMKNQYINSLLDYATFPGLFQVVMDLGALLILTHPASSIFTTEEAPS
jgi:hypothetical protein